MQLPQRDKTMSVLTAEVQSHIYRIYDSINDVSPADWQRLTGNALDLGMDPRMIRVLEETLADQCRMWTMMVEDPTGVVVACACACLCLFVVDALVAAPLAVRKIAEFIRTGSLSACLRREKLFSIVIGLAASATYDTWPSLPRSSGRIPAGLMTPFSIRSFMTAFDCSRLDISSSCSVTGAE